MAISYRGEGGVGGRGGSSMGSGIRKTVKKVAEKAAEKESIIRIANTKPVRAATKVTVKAVNKATKKSADAARQKNIDAFSTNYIANRSVRVMPGTNKARADYMNAVRDSANKNQREKAANPSILDKVKKGGTVKISSAPAKSPDAARAANAKALKAANKKKK